MADCQICITFSANSARTAIESICFQLRIPSAPDGIGARQRVFSGPWDPIGQKVSRCSKRPIFHSNKLEKIELKMEDVPASKINPFASGGTRPTRPRPELESRQRRPAPNQPLDPTNSFKTKWNQISENVVINFGGPLEWCGRPELDRTAR